MSIDKSLYAAPQGLAAEPITVEIEDPEAVHVEGPGFEVHMEKDGGPDFDANLAEEMDEEVLYSLSADLLGDYDKDLQDRKEWLEIYIRGLKLLGLKYEERSEPWPGASGVFHPLLMEAAVKFQAEMIMETFPAAGPVRTKVIGKETPQKKQSAVRVEADMNYTLTEGMPEYRPEHEKTLLTQALAGNAFKKIYFNPSISLPEAPFIPPEDVIVPYGASSIESAERITHRMRKTKNDIRKLQVAGFYRDIDLGDPMQVMDEVEKEKAREQGMGGFTAMFDNRFQILEMHVDLDLEGYEDEDKQGHKTGIALPYIVTIEKGTRSVLAIRRNWLEDDKNKLRRQHFVHYGYIPGFGFYYFGLIHLIGGHTQTATSLLRQLIDAGTLSNLPGGLKARGLRVKGDDTPIAPGEFRDVDLPSGSIRDNILPLPYKEPSQTLVALLDKVVADGRQFAATAELNVSDMSAQAPVGTTLALLERVLKVMSAVQARTHYTMKQEFKLLAAIIRDNTPEDYDYEPEVGDASAKRGDYDCCDVLPVSDPNASTMAQRVVQYQAVIQLAQGAPQIYDLPFLHRQMIETLGVKNAQKIVPMRDDMKPMDPISENMAVLNGKPVKAFIYQDHQAHIAVHQAAMQDPKIAALVGQNPQAPALQAAAMAHIMEHVAFQYRREMEQKLGAMLPPPPVDVLAGGNDADDEPGAYLSPEMESQLAALAAMASAQLLQQHQNEAQQQQAQQQAQDPLIQMQQQELQIKQQEVQLKAQTAQAELQFKQQQLQLEKYIADKQMEMTEKKTMIDAAARADEHQAKQQDSMMRAQMDKTKLVVNAAQQSDQLDADAMKHHSTLQHQHRQAMMNTAADLHKHQTSMENQSGQEAMRQMHEGGMTTMKQDHEVAKQTAEHEHQAMQKAEDRKHQADLAAINARKSAQKEGE
jgi:hypothetical protein